MVVQEIKPLPDYLNGYPVAKGRTSAMPKGRQTVSDNDRYYEDHEKLADGRILTN